MQQVTVCVPASTSNLGPGFDCLGLALCVYNDVIVSKKASNREPPSRIVSEAADRFFEQARRRPFPFFCSITERIPRGRGLGSSATIRLGVLHGLNRLSGSPLDRVMIFQLCAELEGHPDNAAPANFGGFTVVHDGATDSAKRRDAALRRSVGAARRPYHQDGRHIVQRFEVSERLYFVLLIPDFEINTSSARRVLPRRITRAAALENCANACAITAAFVSDNYGNLSGAFGDYLHQPYRKKLIPFLPRVIAAAQAKGALGAFLSGSGSAICALTLHLPKKVATAMLRAAATPARTIITHADNRGARLRRSPDH